MLRAVDRRAVALRPGPLRDQLKHQHRLFLGIDNDRLLKPFRVLAGQAAPGSDMGGWYDASSDFHVDPADWGSANWHGYIPGHSFGQYLSGLARIHAATGVAATRVKVQSMVDGYAATISPRFFDDYNLPAYTYDKIVIGLVDAYRYAGVAAARGALDRVTDAVLPFLPTHALTREERRALPYTREAQIWDEPYTLPEHLFLASEAGMGERYRALALRFLQDKALFDPLARGQSPLAGKHAYSHVNALNSAFEAYRATGAAKYLAAAVNGFGFVEAQSYASGGWGPNEELVGPDDHDTLYRMLSETHRSFETPCGVFGHYKIAMRLLGLTGDSRYGDGMERLLYNAILGAKPTLADGSTFYYSDYNANGRKVYRGEAWPCCSGSFIQLAADYGISSYLLADGGVYFNLYVPSTIDPGFGEGVRLTQSGDYPYDPRVTIDVEAARPTAFDLHLRIPAWAGPHTRITVNGKPQDAVRPGSFAKVTRRWRQGDRVVLELDFGMRLEPLNEQHADMVALMTGPLVLFPIEPKDAVVRRAEWLAAKRVQRDLWQVASADAGTLNLRSFPSIGGETYSTYQRLPSADLL